MQIPHHLKPKVGFQQNKYVHFMVQNPKHVMSLQRSYITSTTSGQPHPLSRRVELGVLRTTSFFCQDKELFHSLLPKLFQLPTSLLAGWAKTHGTKTNP